MTSNKSFIAVLMAAIALPLSFPVASFSESTQQGHIAKPAADSAHKPHHGNGHGDHDHHGVKVKHLEISTAWTRATVKTAKVGGGYITIKNTGNESDRLIAGTADFAKDVQLHQMTLIDDVMRMHPVDGGIDIPAGGEVVLQPGGQHLMFMGLQRPLLEGEEVSVSLTFERAGDVSVSFKVNSLAAKNAHEHGAHSGHAN